MRNAAGKPVHLLQRLGGECDRGRPAGDCQPVRHVRGNGLPIERLELVADRHALIELPQFRRAQQRLQIELAHQDDLEQLLLVGFEI
jgi:hypothetical protein